jgi:hypothetical protein
MFVVAERHQPRKVGWRQCQRVTQRRGHDSIRLRYYDASLLIEDKYQETSQVWRYFGESL